MKRQEKPYGSEGASPRLEVVDTRTEGDAPPPAVDDGATSSETYFLIEDGKLRALSPEDYTTSTVYQMVESFSVERRFVRPEESNNIVYEGKKPSKKTIPVLVGKDGGHVILNSWDDLDSSPEQLSEAREVIGATPVKQIFVLRKK